MDHRTRYEIAWLVGLHPWWYSFNDADEPKRQKKARENLGDVHKFISFFILVPISAWEPNPIDALRLPLN